MSLLSIYIYIYIYIIITFGKDSGCGAYNDIAGKRVKISGINIQIAITYIEHTYYKLGAFKLSPDAIRRGEYRDLGTSSSVIL